jgi:hypothetical protein
MKTLIIYLTIPIFIFTCFNLYAQDRLVAKRIDSLSLDYYLENPTYFINKNYVVFEYRQTRKVIEADIASFHLPRSSGESGIACDKNGVYFQGDLLKTDTTGLRLISGTGDYGSNKWFWKTSDKVFENVTERSDIDAKTFQSISSGYFRDKNHVYYCDTKIVGSDPGTVSGTSNPLVYYDKNNIYNKGKIMYYHDQKLSPVNYTLSKAQNEVIANYAFMEDYYVNRQTRAVSSIDAPTLKGLSRFYSADKHHIYFDSTAMPIKPKNFKHVKVWDQVNSVYVSDGINVYHGADPDTAFDAQSFGVLPHSDFCYDKNGVHGMVPLVKEKTWGVRKFPFDYKIAVKPDNTFITDNNRYIVYDHQAFDPWDGKLFPNLSNDEIAELKSGKLAQLDRGKQHMIGNNFFIIDNQLYQRDTLIKNIDTKTFKYIDFAHFSDKYHVYFMSPSGKTEIIPDADSTTFVPFTYGFYRDKNNIYYGLHKLIKSDYIEFLAIFRGLRESGDEGDGPFSNYCLFKNKDGYWLVETLPVPIVDYLGKTFDRKWNKVFANFEIPNDQMK